MSTNLGVVLEDNVVVWAVPKVVEKYDAPVVQVRQHLDGTAGPRPTIYQDRIYRAMFETKAVNLGSGVG